MQRTVTTEATARRETAPELARVELTVTAGGESAATARTAVDDRAANVRDPLTTVVDPGDVRTTDRRIESSGEMFDPSVDEAFQATVELTVDCVPETAEDVVVTATNAGVTVDRVEWHPHESVCRRLHDEALEAATERAREKAEYVATAEGLYLVSDAMWTQPPIGETATSYLADSIEEAGVRLATNMSDAVRYHAMANTDFRAEMTLDAPHVELEAETVMPESLITSIQPHYQIRHAPDLPEYFTYALRVAAPLLALGVNSPFFPPDLYDDADDEEIVADAWMEHRIGVFEDVLNPADDDRPAKVRFPRDIDSVEAAVDRVLADPLIVPVDVDRGERFDDEFAHLRHKHGSYWRWIRPVFGGATRSSANARIEFRPLPAQPTVRDAVSFEAVFAGLMETLPRVEHPVRGLAWERARENFYAAVADGIDAELAWIGNHGELTHDHEELFADLLDHAVAGLESAGCAPSTAERWIAPLRWRAHERMTPARWKRDRVRDRLDDGASFEAAVVAAQREYIENQTETLVDGSFTDW